MKHTETPWFIGEDNSIFVVGFCIATVNGASEQMPGALADAEFIVRACNAHDELLEAAKKQVALIESEEMKGVQLPIAKAISFQEALNKLRQAIAKAEGGRG